MNENQAREVLNKIKIVEGYFTEPRFRIQHSLSRKDVLKQEADELNCKLDKIIEIIKEAKTNE